MENSLFLQIHMLTSFHASRLNSDDTGQAKRIQYGGFDRTRVSSQTIKYRLRTFDGKFSLRGIEVKGGKVEDSVRSRRTFDRYIRQPLVEKGFADDLAVDVTSGMMKMVLGESAKSKATKDKDAQAAADAGTEPAAPSVETKQVTVLGHPELRYILEISEQIASDLKDVEPKKRSKLMEKVVKDRFGKEQIDNLRSIGGGAGLTAAMFGRMVTSDILARCDAAIHVAHMFTVHETAAEQDYFSALDDIVAEEGEHGSGHVNTSELTTGLYYGYVVIDIPLLVSNLTGCAPEDWLKADRELAAAVIRSLIHTLSTISPGAKRGSTAPYSYASFMMVSSGDHQPSSFANAFLVPVRSSDILAESYNRIKQYVDDLEQMYGGISRKSRAIACMGPADHLGDNLLSSRLRGCPGNGSAIDKLANWASSRVIKV